MKIIAYIICLAFAVISYKDRAKQTDEVTNADTETTTQETSVELVWMEKIADADWTDNSASDHKLKFGKPTIKAGIVTGELEEHFPGLINLIKYESPSEGVLNIHLLKTIRDGNEEQRTNKSSLKLQLIDDDKTLIIDYPDGRTLRYTRSQNNNSVKETVAEINSNNSKNQLWMDKIATADWKNTMNHQIVRFSKPTFQGEIIKGEVEMHEESFIQVFRYERTSDGEMKCRLVRFKIKGDKDFTEENSDGKEFDFSFQTEFLDNGNTLVLNHSNGTKYTYKH